MEHLALLIALAALLIWAIVGLFAGGSDRLKPVVAGAGLGLSLIQLGCAIWAAVRLFSVGALPQWGGTWFVLSPAQGFHIKFSIDVATSMAWLALSVITSLSAYFCLLAEVQDNVVYSRGEKAAMPLLAMGTLLCMVAGNIVVYYSGWSLIVAVAFMAIALSSPTSDRRAMASFRYIILNCIPEVIFAAGVLGVYSAISTLDFATINEQATQVPAWATTCLVLGVMLRNMQLPFMQSVRHVASADSMALPVFFIGQALVGATLFTKLYPTIAATDGIHYYSLIPLITALTAAVLALPERNSARLAGWITTYLSATIFLSALAGHYQAVHAMAVAGVLTAYFFAKAIHELRPGDAGATWIVGAAAVFACGLPIAGMGWARYLEYAGLLRADVLPFPWPGLALGAKVLADLLMCLAIWAKAKDYWFGARQSGAQAPRWEVVVPLVLVAILCISAVTGGRPLGGIAGPFELEIAPVWFEKLVVVPQFAAAPQGLLDAIGSDADVISRVLVIGVLLISVGFGALWLFGESPRLEELRAFWQRLVDKGNFRKSSDTLLWDFVIRPINEGLGKAAAYFDEKILDYFLSDRWLAPARWVRSVFRTIEHYILDEQIVDGLGQAVATLGKALRLLQNGQVQFYFGIGLILMGAIVIKFIVVGWGG